MPRPELISVVVPSFNHAPLVEGALRSVAAQDYPELELIVVDDASSDGTAAVARSVLSTAAFRARFANRVELVEQSRNRGAHDTINAGLGRAGGSFLTILNSDDAYHPHRLSRMVAALDQREGDLAVSLVRCIDESGADITDVDPFAALLSHCQREIPGFPTLGFAALRMNVAISSGNLFFRRTLWERLAPFAPLRVCHDWEFLLRALLVSEPVLVPEPLYLYRLHAGNTFRAAREAGDAEARRILLRYFEQVRCNACPNPLAPAPCNWPGVFEWWITTVGLKSLWEEAAAPK